ncbi:MAG: hypothetical protein IIC74_03490 [Bacteroidetes bacterium]|nr:hypothetical protein [Bacteroidota bacterium]
MNYEKELISYLKNTFGTLDYEYTDDTTNASILFHNAIEFSKSKNSNEKVLSIILYHQSTIEMMKQLIIYSNFLVKLLVYPNKIRYKKIQDDDSYSYILNTLENHISFKNKDSLLSDIRKLNKIRNTISHYMFQDDYESYSFFELNNINKLLESIFNKFHEGIIDLGNGIKIAKQRDELIKLIKNSNEHNKSNITRE